MENHIKKDGIREKVKIIAARFLPEYVCVLISTGVMYRHLEIKGRGKNL
jgi:hypothetical protein